MNKIELTQNTVTSETTVMTMQGYLAKIWESPKLVIEQKCPSSQIPFFTYKPLTKFAFEACQIWIIQTHPNSSKLIRIHLNHQIWLFG
jgi:hypothetical protein